MSLFMGSSLTGGAVVVVVVVVVGSYVVNVNTCEVVETVFMS